ncbi:MULTISPECIES: class I SAM-dependent methyltransferase [Crateriforma]|nr:MULTISPECIES: class I SAM-dependent methyltransferase [Crateriforma]
MLIPIDLPRRWDERPLPAEIRLAITAARQRIETFQDCWDRDAIEQFVAADYEAVYQTLAWVKESQPLPGNRFCEWGCGFAVVACLATELGFDSIGIETEPDLIRQGRDTLADWFDPPALGPELVAGNFLPPGTECLADDPTLPSLGHHSDSAYEILGLDLDDFAVVYSYPWPGENDYHCDVFDARATVGAIHIQFAGPHDVRVYRKSGARR